jgi:hypothetical protein
MKILNKILNKIKDKSIAETRSIISIESKKDFITNNYNENALFADGFEDALAGVVLSSCNNSVPVCAYDYEKMVDILIDRDGMTYEEAIEYIDYNVTSAYFGENTPKYVVLFKGR